MTEFVVFVMRTVASEGAGQKKGLSEKEAQTIRERLRRLGYLD